ncbi:MAG: tetratricopeptide repeat protein [Deltaproteobacteria bacterium]|nr:tetratricopeptide repeat protein [Deltaproteobacteria bacterium]
MRACNRPAAPAYRAVLAAGGLAVALLGSPARAAGESAPERALQLHDEARTLYGVGKYEEAIAQLEKAVRLDPSAKVLFYNLGLIEEKTGRHDDALRHYHRCLKLEKDPREREQLQRIIDRIEGVKRHGPSSERPPAPSGQPGPPAPAADPSGGSGVSSWVWVTGAGAVSALAIGLGLAGRAAALHPGGDATTGPDVSVDDLRHDAEEAHSLAIGADVAFGLAAAATAATVVIALTIRGDSTSAADTGQTEGARPRQAQSDLRLELAPSQGRLVWRF